MNGLGSTSILDPHLIVYDRDDRAIASIEQGNARPSSPWGLPGEKPVGEEE